MNFPLPRRPSSATTCAQLAAGSHSRPTSHRSGSAPVSGTAAGSRCAARPRPGWRCSRPAACSSACTAPAARPAAPRQAAAHRPGSRPAPGRRGTGTAQAETVAYVTARVKTALGNVDNYILRDDQVQTGPGGDSAVNLTDPRTNNDYEVLHDSSGTSLAWLSTYLVNRVLTWKDIEADYSARTWFVDVFTGRPIQGSTAGATSNVMTPAEIKAWLDSGRLKIVGHQVINGHQTIGLRQPVGPGVPGDVGRLENLPAVRTITADFANQKGPLQNVMLIDNEWWLPRTKSLLDTVNHVHIPAGFKQVPPPQ